MNADAGGSTVVTGQGTRVVLGRLIKSGGAGSVYRMRDMPAQVAKIYHANQDLKLYERKVTAMLELTPELPDLDLVGKRIVQVAWPQQVLRDAQRRFLGYLMPAVDVDATSELECVLQERQARRMNLPTGLGPKVTLAANLAAVIAELHRQHHYVVDLKPVNLRFYRDSLYMAMLDCDGFSIQGKGERFEAPQFTADYLAPEFHARGLTTAGELAQDRFALAVVVFQLLNFGIHPFTGRPAHDAVPTDIPSRIAGRWYAHGIRPNPSLLPTPSSGHAAMPAELRALFDRAFENAGGTRPSADEWANVLRGYAQRAAGKLVVCRREVAHQHFAGLQCAACARADKIAVAQRAGEQQPARSPWPPPSAAPRRPGQKAPPPPPPQAPQTPQTPQTPASRQAQINARIAKLRQANQKRYPTPLGQGPYGYSSPRAHMSTGSPSQYVPSSSYQSPRPQSGSGDSWSGAVAILVIIAINVVPMFFKGCS